MLRFRRFSLDVTGTAAAVICAMHCMATPFFLAAATLRAFSPVASVLTSPLIEWTFVVTSAVLGATSLIPSFTRVHRDVVPCCLFSIGLGLMVSVRIAHAGPDVERFAVPIAALLMIGAHVRNRVQCERCRACTPEPAALRAATGR
jgi:hypothetical protein